MVILSIFFELQIHGIGWLFEPSIQDCKIQVSLVPPPCEELTTKEPSFNATRVKPPGTICTVRPLNTKGRKSM
jgi:hypothetical protein